MDKLLKSVKIKIVVSSWVWWSMPEIPALKRQRQEDFEFEVGLSYIASSRPA
jgi:hypothetical protein